MYQTLHGFGEHVQLSVFRCDLSPQRHVRLRAALGRLIAEDEDQVLLVKLGPATDQVIHGIEVLGRPHTFDRPDATIV